QLLARLLQAVPEPIPVTAALTSSGRSDHHAAGSPARLPGQIRRDPVGAEAGEGELAGPGPQRRPGAPRVAPGMGEENPPERFEPRLTGRVVPPLHLLQQLLVERLESPPDLLAAELHLERRLWSEELRGYPLRRPPFALLLLVEQVEQVLVEEHRRQRGEQ